MRTIAWPLDENEIAEVFRRLRFEHNKWDVYHRGRSDLLPDAIVLSAAEHAELVASAESVWAALRLVEAEVLACRDSLEAIGIEPAMIPLLQNLAPPFPRISRCDFHLAVGGQWVISEFNEDGPGGFTESEGLKAVLGSLCGERLPDLRFAGDLRAAIGKAFSAHQQIGVVYPTGYARDLQQAALIADWLRADSREATCGSPANLVRSGSAWTLFDEPISALFRYYPGEWLAGLPNLEDWQRAAAELPMMNDLGALAAQSKRFYALVSHALPGLPAAERELLARYLPESHLLTPTWRERLILEREHWVLKGAFGRIGDSVHLGIGYGPEEWARVVDKAIAEHSQFAIQARFDAVPLWFSSGLGYASVGVYLVDGRFAGHYSRVAPWPVIDYDACHVATLVETA